MRQIKERLCGAWRFVTLFGLLPGIASGCLLSPERSVAQTWGNPVWADEFNGPLATPNTARWNFDLGNNNGWANHELEVYCGPPGYPNNPTQCPTTFNTATSNAYINGNGNLVIQAIQNGGTWTSARMNTGNGNNNFQYGRIEARMQLPSGAGIWPAFWALGSNISTVPWPGCGETDYMENVPSSGGLGPTKILSSLHGQGYSGGNSLHAAYTFPSGTDVTSFHTYGAIWSPFMVQFYVDDPGNVFEIRTASDVPGGPAEWVFNHPFFLLTNLAVGGDFPGPPNNSTPSPALMLVDYVRSYQAASMPPPDFGNPPPISIKAGATTGNTSPVNLTSAGGAGRVYLQCSTNAPKTTCSVNTGYALNSNVVDLTSSLTGAATVSVATTANSVLPPSAFNPKIRLWALVVIALLLLIFMALAIGRVRGGERRGLNGLVRAGLVLSALITASCGVFVMSSGGGISASISSDGTTQGAYTVTVNAYTGSGNGPAPDASVTIALTVN